MKRIAALIMTLAMALIAVNALAVEEWYYEKSLSMLNDYKNGKLDMPADKVEQYMNAVKEYEAANSIRATDLSGIKIRSTETASVPEEKTPTANYTVPVKEALVSEVIEDSEQTKELVDAFKQALEAGDVLTVFPEEIKAELPEGYETINEVITIKLSGNVDDIVAATVSFKFVTQYKAGEKVYLAFAISPTQWVLKEGYVQEDGSINVKLDKEVIERILDKAVTLVVINK